MISLKQRQTTQKEYWNPFRNTKKKTQEKKNTSRDLVCPSLPLNLSIHNSFKLFRKFIESWINPVMEKLAVTKSSKVSISYRKKIST